MITRDFPDGEDPGEEAGDVIGDGCFAKKGSCTVKQIAPNFGGSVLIQLTISLRSQLGQLLHLGRCHFHSFLGQRGPRLCYRGGRGRRRKDVGWIGQEGGMDEVGYGDASSPQLSPLYIPHGCGGRHNYLGWPQHSGFPSQNIPPN